MNIINKYFWSLNEQALKDTEKILKNPTHSQYLSRAFTLLSRCDKPKELFSLMSRQQFLETWPQIRRYWQKKGQAKDFCVWWETIFEELTGSTKKIVGELPEELKKIGKIIQEARTGKGWSQADLSIKTGIIQPLISNVEKGKSNLTVLTLVRLCKVLGVDVLAMRSK